MNDKTPTPSLSYTEILNAISDSAIMLDRNFKCLYLTEDVKKIFDLDGKGPGSIVGKNFFSKNHRAVAMLLHEKVKEAKEINVPLVYDEYVLHLQQWYKFRIYPSKNFLLVLIRNNNNEVIAFNQIKESEEYHRTLIENVKDYAIFALDEKGKIKTWNKGAERLLGYTSDDTVGKSPSMFYSKEARRGESEKKQLQLVKSEGKFEQEGWWVRKDGSHFWANEILAYFKDERGGMRGYTKVVRDMSERKNTEEMLKRYTRDLEKSTRAIETEVAKDEALLDSIGEGVIATDEAGRVVVFNKQAQSLLGWSQEDAIGETCYNLWKIENEEGEFISEAKHPVALVLKNGKKIAADSSYYYASPYRKKFPVMTTASPVVLEGRTIGAVIVFHDISKEKEVDRAKSEFVSLASHQLRTPLTAIKLFVEMLSSGTQSNLSKEQIEMLQSINESNEKMIRLVENLLNVSRLETGVLTVKFEQVILKDFVSETVRELEAVANARKCNLVLYMTNSGNVKINTDPVLLRQVLNNLINNAIAYSPERRCTIEIGVIIDPDSQYKITVRDEGIGIPKDALPNIFQRFYRADNAVKARTEGNGLGLYMCKMMTETLGGKITCVSRLNMGTTFTLIFPLRKPKKIVKRLMKANK